MRVMALCNLVTVDPGWRADWVWGLSLVVLTVILHVPCLGLIRVRAVRSYTRTIRRGLNTTRFAIVIGTATLLATILHGVEVVVWAAAYRFLGAIPDDRSAVLYSLNAITSYGHTNLQLEARWELMGALESLNGWLLFGLTTAFLFATIERVWSLDEAQPKSVTLGLHSYDCSHLGAADMASGLWRLATATCLRFGLTGSIRGSRT